MGDPERARVSWAVMDATAISVVLGIGNTVAIVILAIMAVKGYRRQQRQEEALRREDVRITHIIQSVTVPDPPSPPGPPIRTLRARVVNYGHLPVFVHMMEVRFRDDHFLSRDGCTLWTVTPGQRHKPLAPGEDRDYERPFADLRKFIDADKVVISVRSNKDILAVVNVDLGPDCVRRWMPFNVDYPEALGLPDV